MDDDWDTGFTATQTTENTDMNNNESSEKKSSFGFGGGASRGGFGGDQGGRGGFGGRGGRGGSFGGGFGNRDDDNGEKREGGFGGERRGGFGGGRGGGRGGGFGNREGGFGNREGGFGNREGSFGNREGGYGNREGGFGNREGSGGRGGGFGNREGGGGRGGGFGNREGGFGNREGGFGNREGGFGNREGGFGNREGGFGNREGGFGNREGGFGNREGGFGNREGGFGNREGGFGNREGGGGRGGGFGNREGGFGNREGGFGNREGGFGNREGGFRNRDEQGERGGFGGRGGSRGGFGGEGRSNFGDRNGTRGGFGGGDEGNGGFRGSKGFGGDEGAEADVPRKERYIPESVEDTEATLFKNIETGVNFKKQSEIAVNLSGNGAEDVKPLEKFVDAELSELLLSNVQRSGYEIPTPVQKYAIPAILKKRDVMACAQTGSGKTAAFVLPIMTNILKDGIESSEFTQVQTPQALILSPTRELALQIYNECKKFSYKSMIKSGILYGGVDTRYQLSNLEKGCNILVATPGRLLDVLEKGKISLEKVKYFVLDEADRMLSMGFEDKVRDILKNGSIQAKGERTTLMFSATFPTEIQQLAQDFMNDYLFLAVGVVGGANSDVTQTIHKVSRFEKRDKTVEIINEIGNDKVMVFVEHKKQADILAFFLIQKGYPTTTLHGDRLQSQRETALNSFKAGKTNIIVCTSVAARGLDIEKVNHVINYDLPQTIDDYVHRIGRTGRCGNLGKAISYYDESSANDQKLARPLVKILTEAQQEVPQWLSDAAEGSVGSAFTGAACNDDLRDTFSKLTVAPAAKDDDDAWD